MTVYLTTLINDENDEIFFNFLLNNGLIILSMAKFLSKMGGMKGMKKQVGGRK